LRPLIFRLSCSIRIISLFTLRVIITAETLRLAACSCVYFFPNNKTNTQSRRTACSLQPSIRRSTSCEGPREESCPVHCLPTRESSSGRLLNANSPHRRVLLFKLASITTLLSKHTYCSVRAATTSDNARTECEESTPVHSKVFLGESQT
jgi:hypothetical protein